MYLDLIEDPWTLSDHAVSLSDYTGNMIEIDGRKDPRIVCGASVLPWFRKQNNKLPSVSFPFLDRGEIKSFYYLPTPSREKQEKDFRTAIGVQSEIYWVMQKDSVVRYTENMQQDTLEFFVNSWINWSVRLFQEIADDSDGDILAEDSFKGLARRTWERITEHVNEDGENEAMMSLIVQLAGDHRLRDALHSISRNPRKILERIRQNIKLARIQQMDGACIREYARRPGYDMATKAGSRQELLALNRIENTNTLENRVYIWVLNTIENFAKKYIKENSRFSSSGRVSEVQKFGMESNRMKASPALEMVSIEGLVHPVPANYPLQFDRRYKEIYAAYQKLCQDQKVFDDAWEWQRTLWGGTARLVVYSHFNSCFSSNYTNFVYVRNEGQQGRWLSRSNAPGPFLIDKYLYYLIDSWDVVNSTEWLNTEIFPGAHDIGRLGCDAVFYSPQTKKLLVIWFSFATGNSDENFCQERMDSCYDAIKRFTKDLKRQNKSLTKINGLIVSSLFGENEVPELLEYGYNASVHTLLIPHRSYHYSAQTKDYVKQIIAGMSV